MKNYPLIMCPNCGAEYIFPEIFLPQYVIGAPYKTIEIGDKHPKPHQIPDITKTEEGRIAYIGGKPLDFNERYTCDYCGKQMNVSAKLSFKVVGEDDEDWEDAPVPSLLLNEDD